jgi:two-component system, OmpR family, phosphate regulon sensor histidine kinase PhoR
MQEALRQASGEYRRVLVNAGLQARLLAASRPVQRAFERRDRRQLDRLAGPDVQFVLGRQTHDAVPNRSVQIVVGKRRVGAIVVHVPFDRQLLTRLERASELPRNRRLALAQRRSLLLPSGQRTSLPAGIPLNQPTQVLAGGERDVAVSTVLTREAPATRLVLLAPASEILGSPAAERWRWLLAGLGVLAAVAVTAYALAPLLGRSRLAKRERERAARVLSHLGEGVFLVDSAGIVRLWNAAAETITGLTPEQVCNGPIESALPAWPTIVGRIPTAEREEQSRPETVPVEIGGRQLWLSIAGVEFSDGTVYAFRDATSEQRLEAIRAEFVATVSHELRTPLAALHGAALTLTRRSQELPVETREKLLGMIAAQSKRLASLVEDILLAGQLDAGSLRVEHEPFDAAAVARAAVDEARHKAAMNAMLRISASEDLPQVLGDEARTHQVLANLIDNAVKYSPAGSRVDVEVQRENGKIRFSVRDRGPGIPRAEQEQVFEKFYRLDPDHRYGVGGSGLGLYICRQLVSSMHGRIWVESTPQYGSTFVFDLPAAA